MRATGTWVFSLLLLALATFTTAWPWPRWLPELESLVVRQENNNQQSTSPSPSRTSVPQNTGTSRPTNTADPSNTKSPSSDENASTTTRRSGTVSGTNTQTGSARRTSTESKAQTTEYDPRLPAGGVAMITPSVMDGEQYYKIGDFVTFAWNYTSLEATPTAVNVMATCTANNELYTIAVNQTVTNATQSAIWDTGAYQSNALAVRLLTSKYTLIIYDAASSISANARPGYLAVYNQYSFGMYEKQSYVPLADYVCVTCSGALGDLERKFLGMVFGMGLLTVLSFTWFVSGTGVIW